LSFSISNSSFFTYKPILAHDNTNTKGRGKKTGKQKPSAPPDSGTKIAFWRGAGHLGRCGFWDGAAVFCPVIPAYICLYVDMCMLYLHVHVHIGGGHMDRYRCWDGTAVPLLVIPADIFMYVHIYTLYVYIHMHIGEGQMDSYRWLGTLGYLQMLGWRNSLSLLVIHVCRYSTTVCLQTIYIYIRTWPYLREKCTNMYATTCLHGGKNS